MKLKITSIFLAVVMLITIIPTVSLTAMANTPCPSSSTNNSNGAYEHGFSQGAGVTHLGHYTGNQNSPADAVIVPNRIHIYDVVSIGGDCYNRVGNTSRIISIRLQEPFRCPASCPNETHPNNERGIHTLHNRAFAGLPNLIEVTIPSSVLNIGEDVFINCPKLQRINVAASNPNFSSVNGVLYNKNRTELIKFPSGRNVTSFTVPSTVTSIRKDAFTSLTKLRNVTIPAGVRVIDRKTFDRSKSLQNININASNPNYASTNGVLFNKNRQTLIRYPEGKTAKSYRIPNGVRIIGQEAFYSHNRLETVTFPSSATTISERAFENCTNLKTMTLPNSVTSIEAEAFRACRNLEVLTVRRNSIRIHPDAFLACTKLILRCNRNSGAHRLAQQRNINFILMNVKRKVTFKDGRKTLRRNNVEHNNVLTTKQRNYKGKKKGFKFGGWYADKKLKKRFNLRQRITKNTTVYAKFTRNKK